MSCGRLKPLLDSPPADTSALPFDACTPGVSLVGGTTGFFPNGQLSSQGTQVGGGGVLLDEEELDEEKELELLDEEDEESDDEDESDDELELLGPELDDDDELG